MVVIYCVYIIYVFYIFKDEIFESLKINSLCNLSLNPMYHLCSDILGKNISYFQQLDKPTQDIFIDRTIKFINEIEWLGFQGFEIKERHKILVSATAVQLTFGYEKTRFNNLQRIFIAPEKFYSRIFEREVKGLTMPIAIYLSWEDFENGININNDALNLGLHEFAHALEIQAKLSYDSLDEHYINNINVWNLLSDNIFDLMNLNDNYVGFLREYAKANKSEFFAVTVESFFERPQLMKENEAKLYESMCLLLNQNPLNSFVNFKTEQIKSDELVFSNNFRLSKSIKLFIILGGLISLNINKESIGFIVSKFDEVQLIFFILVLFIFSFLDVNTLKKEDNSNLILLLLGILPIVLLGVKYFNITF